MHNLNSSFYKFKLIFIHLYSFPPVPVYSVLAFSRFKKWIYIFFASYFSVRLAGFSI